MADLSGGIILDDKPPMKVVALQEVIDNFDILTAESSHLVVVDRDADIKLATPGVVDVTEIGSSNTSYGAILRQDYNPQMRGLLASRAYDQMRRNDGQVMLALQAVKAPILGARWFMQPYVSDDGKIRPRNQVISDFIWDNLTKRMSMSWPQFLIEAMTFVDFGWYAFEKVFSVGPDGLIYWQKFAPRHPLDLQYWEYDPNGGPQAGWFYSDATVSAAVRIPIEKLLVPVLNREGGALDGRSIMRPMYKHWYYKENLYKVDAIQKERHGIGIPIIKLPPGYSKQDKQAADQLGRNLRVNEKAYVSLPPLWDIMFAELKGQPVDCMKSIAHHDTAITRAVGLVALSDTPGGSITDADSLFLKGTRFIAEVFRDVINKWAIPELCDINWPNNDGYPELKVRRIGDTTDWRTISFAMRNFVGAGILRPDDKLEDWVRAEMDLPEPDVETARDIGTPQLPGKPAEVAPGSPGAAGVVPGTPPPGSPPGTPQQSTANNMNISPGSNGRIGQDGTGGK